jgi:hypothetical protein
MTAIPVDQPRPRRVRLDIPQIKPVSWLGLESVAFWTPVIAHIIKWAVSFGYFVSFQMRYTIFYDKADWHHTVVGLTDPWDRLPVHISNLFHLGIYGPHRQGEPLWWITMRHDIRDVGIALIATIIVTLLFTKPKYPVDDNPGVRGYLTAIPLAIGAALIPIALVGVLAWQLPWFTQHGWQVPADWGVWASEVNGWIQAGTWITIVMGVLGGLAAKFFINRCSRAFLNQEKKPNQDGSAFCMCKVIERDGSGISEGHGISLRRLLRLLTCGRALHLSRQS